MTQSLHRSKMITAFIVWQQTPPPIKGGNDKRTVSYDIHDANRGKKTESPLKEQVVNNVARLHHSHD